MCLLLALACNERPSDLREWRPTDHDHTDNPGSDQVQVDPNDAGVPNVPGLDDVTIVAWQQNCMSCHGQLGRGDGPRGPMVKARNLSDPAWQASISDEQIAASIKLGKGLMPSFAQLPDATIAKLVQLVRLMNLARHRQSPGAASASATPGAAPSASAKPPSKSDAARPAQPAAPTPRTTAAQPSGN